MPIVRVELRSGAIPTPFEFCAVPAGSFLMGSAREEPVHEVTLSRPFLVGRVPVTQAQWRAVMGTSPSTFPGDDRPVETVSWEDAQAFVARLSAAGCGAFRLPTEAEWEYACRAGSRATYCFGDDAGELGEYAWTSDNAEGATHPVGQKRPNAWGLHDVHGNVWEWCQDFYADYPAGRVTDPEGAPSGLIGARVFRGGCWRGGADFAASAHRGGRGPRFRDAVVGVRLVVELGEGTPRHAP